MNMASVPLRVFPTDVAPFGARRNRPGPFR
jgi:hypothetical protein